MAKDDIIMVKCTRCGSRVQGSVSHEDYRVGRATICCDVCGESIRLAASSPFREAFGLQRALFTSILPAQIKAAGWKRVLVVCFFSSIGLGALMVGVTILHFNQWIGFPIFLMLMFLPSLYIFYVRGGKEVTQRWIQERYGSDQPLPFYQVMSPSHPVKVCSIEEEYQFVASRQCPTCLCPFKTESHGMCFAEPPSKHDRSQKQRKVLDNIQVVCPQCNRKTSFYFDIDEIEEVKRLGYTQQMMLAHILEVQRRDRRGAN